MKMITDKMLAVFESKVEDESVLPVLQAAATGEDISELYFNKLKAARLNGEFNIEVKTRGITAQEKSGRCWEFSALNGLREVVAEKLNLESFEFSQNYLSFYDKLEKCNNYLEMVIEAADKSMDSDEMQYLLRGISDGNVWDQPVGLIKKYGIVPKSVMPETYASNHTSSFNNILNRILKEDALDLRKAKPSECQSLKEGMLAEIYRMECILFGNPVKNFDFSYRDKDNNFHEDRGLTPKTFYEKYVGTDLDEFVHIINEPTEKEPYHRYIVSHDNGNMAENDRRRFNLPMDEFEALCIAQLKAGKPVWIGLDSGSYISRKEGIWDAGSFESELWTGRKYSMSKGDRLTWQVSAPTHDVLLTGVNIGSDGKPERWKIENSWGEDAGKKGFFICSEEYFKNEVFEAAVKKEFMTNDQKKALEQEPVVLKPWEIEQF